MKVIFEATDGDAKISIGVPSNRGDQSNLLIVSNGDDVMLDIHEIEILRNKLTEHIEGKQKCGQQPAIKAPVAAPPCSADDASLIETLCTCLTDAHNEILKLQNCPAEEWQNHDWPEWSGPANTIRWAEKRLGKHLAKTNAWTLYPTLKCYGCGKMVRKLEVEVMGKLYCHYRCAFPGTPNS